MTSFSVERKKKHFYILIIPESNCFMYKHPVHNKMQADFPELIIW